MKKRLDKLRSMFLHPLVIPGIALCVILYAAAVLAAIFSGK